MPIKKSSPKWAFQCAVITLTLLSYGFLLFPLVFYCLVLWLLSSWKAVTIFLFCACTMPCTVVSGSITRTRRCYENTKQNKPIHCTHSSPLEERLSDPMNLTDDRWQSQLLHTLLEVLRDCGDERIKADMEQNRLSEAEKRCGEMMNFTKFDKI